MPELGFKSTLKMSYDEALVKATDALKAEGFGVLTSIDVKDTMKKSSMWTSGNIRFWVSATRPWRTGAVHKSMWGLLLPCTVIVYEEGDGAVVNILNPLAMTELIPEPELQAVMGEARARLARVSEALNR